MHRIKMGQALSSCAPCCSKSAQEIEEPYQMADLNDNGTNPQWKEILMNIGDYKIVFAVDPKSSEEEIAAKRMEILMNIGTENWRE